MQLKGKVLAVKKGYNPNSSSVGTLVFSIPMTYLAATAGFGAVSAAILTRLLNNTKNSTSTEEKSKAKPDESN